jgi:hypothetical protein
MVAKDTSGIDLERADAEQHKFYALVNASFGARVAEKELKELSNYFVETDEWRQLLTDHADIVFGEKGSGKSALYSLLAQADDELLASNVLVVPVEKPLGKPVFNLFLSEPPGTEAEFIGIWKLYFLTVTAGLLREWKIETEPARKVFDALEKAGLDVSPNKLELVLRCVRAYVKRVSQIESGIALDPTSGVPLAVTAKITLADPAGPSDLLNQVSIDELLKEANAALEEIDIAVWLALDRLDVVFSEHFKLEEMALRALFRTYRDIDDLPNIKLKLFLRSDIWRRITTDGFREQSHFTEALTINWDRHSLLSLVTRRLLKNGDLREYYGLDGENLDAETQERLLSSVLPHQLNPSGGAAFDWLVKLVSDGSGHAMPRELIHLVIAARSCQMSRVENGHEIPSGEVLFDAHSINTAHAEVSKARLDMLFAEYPKMKKVIQWLERSGHQPSLQTLQHAWRVTEREAEKIAEELVEIGFFERRGTRRHPIYWIPLLYRPALDIREKSRTFLTFGSQVAELAAGMIMRRLPKSHEANMRGTHAEIDAETVSFEFEDLISRDMLVLYFFASEAGSRYSSDSLSDTIGVGLLDGEMNELAYDEWDVRLGGSIFERHRYFRSMRLGYRFVISYDQVVGSSADEVARTIARRVFDALQRAKIVKRS